METHKTLEEARAEAKKRTDIRCIIEIDHATEGRCFVKAKATIDTLKRVPKPKEIKGFIAQHEILTEAEAAEKVKKYLREHTNCERCGKKIDGNTAYHQKEWYMGQRCETYYCDDCHGLLSQIGIGEHTELEERAASRPSREPYTKEDF